MNHLERFSSRGTAPSRLGWLAAFVLLISGAISHAAPVAIQNADFAAAGNVGSVTGGLISVPTTEAIGTTPGPWSGTYAGVLALLAAPTLTIDDGKATASGLLYTSLLGGINNSGRFHQTLGENVAPGFTYTLKADIDVGGLLSLSLLGTGNAGIAIGNGSSILASSRSGNPLIQLLQGTTYRVTLEYAAPVGVSGPMQVILLAEPSGVVTASLLSSVSFDNVSLDKRLTVQVPTSVVPVDPTAIVCHVGQPVQPGISVVVRDAAGDPISGVVVNYTAPSSGASLSPATGSVTTNNLGVATFAPLANTIAGTYDVNVTVPSTGTTAVVTLTNQAGPAAQFGALPGATPSAVVGNPFSAAVGTRVLDQYGNGVPGGVVQFTAPSSGASAGFPTLTTATVTSDASGTAVLPSAVANTIAGAYDVLVSSAAAQGSIPLVNVAGPATQIGPAGAVGGPIPSATVTTAFSTGPRALVTDALGNPVAGATVSFSAPNSGPSATLSSPTAVTDATGIATVGATANTVAGSYGITVVSGGLTSEVPLTNTAGAASAVSAPAGGLPTGQVGQALSIPVAARVTDAFGNPVPNQTVTFTAPASGPSATLQPSSATTDAQGIARTNGTANQVAGDYAIASTAGAVTGSVPARNMLPPTITTTPDGEPELTADVGEPFGCMLLVRVVDELGVPQPNLAVDFEAPASGASAMLSHGGASGTSVRVPSDVDGFAWVEATSNMATGTYAVTAKLAYSASEPAEAFKLRNAAAGDSAFLSTFDGVCVSTKP